VVPASDFGASSSRRALGKAVSRTVLTVLASWPWPLELALLELISSNDARGFSRFDFARFHFRAGD